MSVLDFTTPGSVDKTEYRININSTVFIQDMKDLQLQHVRVVVGEDTTPFETNNVMVAIANDPSKVCRLTELCYTARKAHLISVLQVHCTRCNEDVTRNHRDIERHMWSSRSHFLTLPIAWLFGVEPFEFKCPLCEWK